MKEMEWCVYAVGCGGGRLAQHSVDQYYQPLISIFLDTNHCEPNCYMAKLERYDDVI